jgi:ribonuclease HII
LKKPKRNKQRARRLREKKPKKTKKKYKRDRTRSLFDIGYNTHMKTPHIDFEKEVWDMGGLACGVDEVGRGSIAGPVVAAAVIMPKGHTPIKNVRDSKKLTPKMRAEIYCLLLDCVSDFGIGLVSAHEIDKVGIGPATKKAMKQAIDSLTITPDLVLVDAIILEEINIEKKAIIKGDESVYSISAASIIAKVYRDAVVSGLDNVYAGYYFSSHKGYGTKKHYDAITARGLTPEHRRTFLK